MSTDPATIVKGYVIQALNGIPQIKQVMDLKPRIEQALGFINGLPQLLEQTKENWVKETKDVIQELRGDFEKLEKKVENSGSSSGSNNDQSSGPNNSPSNNTSNQPESTGLEIEGGRRRVSRKSRRLHKPLRISKRNKTHRRF